MSDYAAFKVGLIGNGHLLKLVAMAVAEPQTKKVTFVRCKFSEKESLFSSNKTENETPSIAPLVGSHNRGEPAATAIRLEFKLNPRMISTVRCLIESVTGSLEWMLTIHSSLSFFCDIHIATKK